MKHRGERQPHSSDTGRSRYLSSVTGATVSDTWAFARSPQGSGVHSALSSRAGLPPSACSLNRRSTRTRPRLGLYDIGRNYSHPPILVKRQPPPPAHFSPTPPL